VGRRAASVAAVALASVAAGDPSVGRVAGLEAIIGVIAGVCTAAAMVGFVAIACAVGPRAAAIAVGWGSGVSEVRAGGDGTAIQLTNVGQPRVTMSNGIATATSKTTFSVPRMDSSKCSLRSRRRHCYLHSITGTMINNRAPVSLIQDLLGHADVSITKPDCATYEQRTLHKGLEEFNPSG
jgi:hypothetical protein